MRREEFDMLVEDALAELPKPFLEKLSNIVITVEDAPPHGERRSGLLLGIFHGVPLTEKSNFQIAMPDRIVIYQRNLEAICRSGADVKREIRDTLLHELGHYFGLSEAELRDI